MPSVILTTNSISPDVGTVAPLDENEVLSITLVVRRQTNPDNISLKEYAEKVIAGEAPTLDHDTFVEHFGSSDEDINTVIAWAKSNNLEYDRHFSPSASVHLNGKVRDINRAFNTVLQKVTTDQRTYVSHDGAIHIPTQLAGIIECVFGLEDSATFNRFTSVPGRNIDPASFSGHITPRRAAETYGITPNGTNQTIAIIELGGGYTTQNLNSSFALSGTATPTITDVVVSGPGNNPTGSDLGTNAEVVGDIVVAGSAAPNANIVVYFANNTAQDFYNVWSAVVNDQVNMPNIISFSYGITERYLGAIIPQTDNIFAAAVVKNITICVSTGDYGQWPYDPAGPLGQYNVQGDVLYPASYPGILAVGGTILQPNSVYFDPVTGYVTSSTFAEEAWNSTTSASGGGVSRRYTRPAYQNTDVSVTTNPAGAVTIPTNRAIPDISAHADDDTNSYLFYVYDASRNNPNEQIGLGGTSMAAPLVAGMVASFNSTYGGDLGVMHNLLYTNRRYTKDVVIGNNNIQVGGVYRGGYEATQGWDAVTGLGSINWFNLAHDYTVSTLTNIVVATTSGQILSLVPTFSSNNIQTASYGVTIDNSETAVVIIPQTPVLNLGINYSIRISGVNVLLASTSPNIAFTVTDLSVGPFNQITVTANSYNNQYHTLYDINVTRRPLLSHDATLGSLYFAGTTSTQVSPRVITLAPTFDTSVTSYVGTVTNEITLLGLNPSANDPGVTIAVNGTSVIPNTFTGPIYHLTTGPNNFAIVVTAGDQTTTKEYDTTIYRLTPGGRNQGVDPPIIYDEVHWLTTASDFGVITSPTFQRVVLASGSDTVYTVISGDVPPFLNVYTSETSCVISGDLKNYPYPYDGEFVVRAYSFKRQQQARTNFLADKTFRLRVAPQSPPWWTPQAPFVPDPGITIGGPADGIFIDRDYMSYQFKAIPGPGGNYPITYSLVSKYRSLPDGLELSSDGILSGILSTDIGRDYISTYTFAIAASDGYASTTQTFVMHVINALSSASTYAEYGPQFVAVQAPEYIGDTYLGRFRDNSNQIIPVTAYDPYPWMGPVTYSYNTVSDTLPLGLELDPTGYLYGYIPPTSTYLISYEFPIIATKTRTLDGTTATTSTVFSLDIIRSDEDNITWLPLTGQNSGTIINPGTYSLLSIAATHTETKYPLVYSQVAGSLPKGIKLLPSGNISGASTQTGIFTATFVASTSSVYYNQQTWNQVKTLGVYQSAISQPRDYTLTILPSSKFSVWNPANTSTYKQLDTTYNAVYLQPYLPLSQRRLYNDFVNDQSIFVPELLYRPDDPVYGVRRELRLYVIFGMFELNSLTNYESLVALDDQNPNKLSLGYLSTVTNDYVGLETSPIYFTDVQYLPAYNLGGEYLYDFVYVGIEDPTNLVGKIRDYFSNATFVVPEWRNPSTATVINRVGEYIGLPTNANYLPTWQRTVFNQGGKFFPAVGLCYASPGNGIKIVDRYKRSLLSGGFKFNQINFTVDRMIIDNTRSAGPRGYTGTNYLIFGA